MILIADSSSGILPILIVSIAWIVREVAGLVIKGVSARLGKVFYNSRKCGFYCTVQTEDNRKVEAWFLPEFGWENEQKFPLQIEGELINDTGTPVIYVKPKLRFIGPESTKLVHNNPTVQVDGKTTNTISIPSHGYAELRISIDIPREILNKYAQTIPFLNAETLSGKKHSFRLYSCSFYGRPIVAWPRKGDRLIVVGKTELKNRTELSSPD